MATFLSGAQCGVWGSNPRYCTLTGDVSRSGNTVTLSNLRLYFTLNYGYASGVAERMCIRNGGTIISDTTVTWSFNGSTSNTVSLNNCSFGVGTTETSHTLNLYAIEDNASANFTVTFPTGATAPSGLSVSVTSRTYNTLTMSGSLNSWGTHSGSNQAFCLGVFPSSATSWAGGRREWINNSPGETKSYSATLSNSSTSLDGGVTLKGCGAYKAGIYARNGSGLEASYVNSTVYYTPPAQPSISVTDAGYTFTNRKVTVTCTGANTSYNNNNTVTFYYRYKKSTDANYGSWVSMGTGTATSSKSATLTLDGSTTYNFQVLQQYQSQNSDAASANYTTPAVPDQGILYGPVNGVAKKIIKLYGSVNGQTKEIKKLYGSVNGQSKRIF